MITISEAIQLIEKNLPSPKIIILPTVDTNNFVCTQSIYAKLDSPIFDNSAMDGYAITQEDTIKYLSNEKFELEIIGESRAGISFQDSLVSGKCIQINTGAKIPIGAASVVPVEDVIVKDNRVQIQKLKKLGQNIRKQGEEYTVGSKLVDANVQLNERILSLLLGAGVFEIEVYQKPKVLLITTGSELVQPNQSLADGKIIDINGFLIGESLVRAGFLVDKKLGIEDTKGNIFDVLNLDNHYNAILITGGVSVGPFDYVKEDASLAGFHEIFWKIQQKPGKPMFFAKKKDTLLFGLPGNPVSAYMNYQHYVLPALYTLSKKAVKRKMHKFQIGENFHNQSDRTELLRVILDNNKIRKYQNQNSHILGSLANTIGYIVLEPEQILYQDDWTDIYFFQ